jgi:ABC-type lipoprotein release transport system permease subunit
VNRSAATLAWYRFLVTSIALAAVTALLLANLVAAVPRRRAARTPAAEALRSE